MTDFVKWLPMRPSLREALAIQNFIVGENAKGTSKFLVFDTDAAKGMLNHFIRDKTRLCLV